MVIQKCDGIEFVGGRRRVGERGRYEENQCN